MSDGFTCAALDAEDREHLLDVLDGALRVHTRAQFYLWTQGALQRFLPHQTVLCLSGAVARLRFELNVFSRVVDAAHDQATGRQDNMLLRLVDDWLRSGQQPRLFPLAPEGRLERRQLAIEFRRRGLGHVAAHGARAAHEGSGSLFVFLGLDQIPDARHAYLLELLMPHLHMALYRVLQLEAQTQAQVPADEAEATHGSGGGALTRRQLQVLLWVKSGKTNEEIASILDLSPPTVKNHVQKILRKLGANNRAQAVGKADSLGLFAIGARARSGDSPSGA
jgi:transcriptional regulator EpsA